MRFKSVYAAALFLFLPLAACQAESEPSTSNYSEGTDYRTITPPIAVDAPRGKVQVLELFYYGCPHCYDMEPTLQEWVKKNQDKVEFVRVPAVFKTTDPNGSMSPWYIMARAFYAAEALGVLEKVHPKLFHAIHTENRKLHSQEEVTKFFVEQGVKAEDFNAAFNSFSVQTKVARAAELVKNSGIDGVPALIVDGKYQTLGKRATSYDDYMKITGYLVKRALGAR